MWDILRMPSNISPWYASGSPSAYDLAGKRTPSRSMEKYSDDPWNQTCADNPMWLRGHWPPTSCSQWHYNDLGLQPPFAMQSGLWGPPRDTNILARAVFPGVALYSPAASSPSLQSPLYLSSGVLSTMSKFWAVVSEMLIWYTVSSRAACLLNISRSKFWNAMVNLYSRKRSKNSHNNM